MPYYEHFFVEMTRTSDLTAVEYARLAGLITVQRPRCYIEVGVGLFGTFSKVAALTHALGLPCSLHGIDAFGRLPRDCNGQNSHEGDVIHREDAQNFLSRAAFANACTLHRGDSAPILSGLLSSTKGPRLVFIDGNHTYAGCHADFAAIEDTLEAGDIVVFHDSVPDQHPDYGRGPRGVVEDHVLTNRNFRLLTLAQAAAAATPPVDTITAAIRTAHRGRS